MKQLHAKQLRKMRLERRSNESAHDHAQRCRKYLHEHHGITAGSIAAAHPAPENHDNDAFGEYTDNKSAGAGQC